ncbi:hypothetical protein [Methylobacterium sp. Gmos1]
MIVLGDIARSLLPIVATGMAGFFVLWHARRQSRRATIEIDLLESRINLMEERLQKPAFREGARG